MRTHNSWRSVLLKGLLGTAVFALANLITYQLSGYFEREQAYHGVVSGFFSRPHVKALFVGDSHVAQLDNEYLAAGVYNVGFGGDSLREVYAKLRYLLSEPNELDTLFLTADAHMFGSARLQSSNGAFADLYLLRTASAQGLAHGWLAAAFNLVPLFNDDFVQYLKVRLSQALKGARADRADEEEALWQSLPPPQRAHLALEAGALDHAGIALHPEPFQWYARILALARAHGLRVIAIRYPATPQYLQSVTPQQQAALDQALGAAGVHDLLDFRYAFTDGSYFKDPDHLSRKGIDALLRLIESRTDRTLWRTGGRSEALQPPLSIGAEAVNP